MRSKAAPPLHLACQSKPDKKGLGKASRLRKESEDATLARS